MVRNLRDVERLLSDSFYDTIQDYRGFPISLYLRNLENFPLSDEILKMKNVNFYFPNESKPIHKLVSPEPHFVKEERNLIENHFKYLGPSNKSDDIEEWRCFEMDCEGHLVSLKSSNFHLSNESIEHLSNFPQLRELGFGLSNSNINGFVTNFSLLSDLKRLIINFGQEFQGTKFLKDLGLFSNLIYLYCSSPQPGILLNIEQQSYV